jgi:CheY-like chemotaxis protein
LQAPHHELAIVPPAVPVPSVPDAEAATGALAGTVLIIDDDGSARDVLARTLAREGFHVLAAATGQEGLRLARERKPDVITLDVLMPGQDGWAVLRGLKSDPALSQIPVVMVTMVDERSLALELGAAGYLVKPVERERLLDVLRRQLGGGRDSVLIVDDDAATREMLARLLRREGWSVLEAADGRAGLELVARCQPALVLLDLLMPDVDGFEFLERLNAAPVPIVVLTAKDLTTSEVRRLQGRVRAIMQKASLRREDLLQEVRRHLNAAL